MARVLFFIGLWAFVIQAAYGKNILDEIREKPNLSQVLAIIEEDRLLPALMTTQGFTAFMPTNQAMDAFNGTKDRQLIRYHMANIPYLVQDLPDEINTELSGNPRLYISRHPTGEPAITGHEHMTVYINNAKVISANQVSETDEGVRQVLHIIDQVIAPTVPLATPNDTHMATLQNPDARKLLERPRIYGLVDRYSISDFEKRVTELQLADTFSLEGKNTFFIPINAALNNMIDKQVVHGHIVPDRVLFTRTVESPIAQYESLAFTDNLKVFVSMENVTDSDDDATKVMYYVKSNTLYSDASHNKGTVMARIVKANIPVKNGVVHLIDRPLMVVADSISSYLQVKEGQLSKFYTLMNEHYKDLSAMLVIEDKNLTLFAPSNDAFNMVNKERLEKVLLSKEKVERLLLLHVINRRLTTDEIIEQRLQKVFQEPTMSHGRELFFAVNQPPPSSSSSFSSMMPVVSLEGAGVNATITTANIAAKNGVIHIIDRILGIPSQTVYEKLASDPMLSASFSLSEQNHWNARLDNRNEKFTLFVPSNSAWDYIRRTSPSSHKKLFMGDFSYHVRYILERHMIVGAAYNLEQLASLTTNASTNPNTDPSTRPNSLQMMRGKIYFQPQVREGFGAQYRLEWVGVKARVIRPDVECVNGIVHVIDNVLMLPRDVTVAGAASVTTTSMMMAIVLTLAVVR